MNSCDHLVRRVQKITPKATHSFFYDGWMLVKEVIVNTNGTTDVVECHWGNDLSGSRGGAAGVGGLLYISVTHSSTPNSPTPNSSTHQLYIPWYDSNGNIMGYWDERGKVAASFDYGAFGETSTCGDDPAAFPIRFSTKYHDVESDLYYYTKRFYHPYLHRWLTQDPIEEDGGVNMYAACKNNFMNSLDLIGLWSATWASRCERRRVYRKGNGDTIKGLSDKIGMDETTFHLWARIETTGKAVEDKPGKTAPSSDYGLKEVCYISVPNVWIEADLLRGGGFYDRTIVNLGGTIGSFFGQTLGRWGYHTLKPGTPNDLLKTVQYNSKDIYGLTVYAHGTPNGYYIVAPDGRDAINQLSLMRMFRKNGYRIAAANMMQCYSINPKGSVPIWPKDHQEFNYKKAWEKSIWL